MTERHIKVVFHDGEYPDVYDNDKRLNRKEIVELLIEYFEDCDELITENEQLKQELFEAKKDYLIETADISDTLHLDEDIKQLRQEIFGDVE